MRKRQIAALEKESRDIRSRARGPPRGPRARPPPRPPPRAPTTTPRSIDRVTGSRGSTYPEGIVHRPDQGPYVFRTTRRSAPRAGKPPPAPGVGGGGAMEG